jgi:hypothetical protein
MRSRLVRRLVGVAAGVALLSVALVAGSVSVGAAPPSLFTRNGCDVGNYSCLQDALGHPVFDNRGFFYNPYSFAGYYPIAYYPPYAYVPIPAPMAVTATIVSGRVVTVGQQVAATVDGFAAGETVTASVTAPNGQVTQVGSAPAAADGSVTVGITFPSAGTWQVTLHGQTSNKNVVDSYTVQ